MLNKSWLSVCDIKTYFLENDLQKKSPEDRKSEK